MYVDERADAELSLQPAEPAATACLCRGMPVTAAAAAAAAGDLLDGSANPAHVLNGTALDGRWHQACVRHATPLQLRHRLWKGQALEGHMTGGLVTLYAGPAGKTARGQTDHGLPTA